MSVRILLGAALFLVLLSGQAAAQNPYQQAMAEMEVNAVGFIQAKGHVPVDTEAVIDGQYYSEERFPGARNQQALSRPDSDIDPLTRAILLLEATEVRLRHVRYRIAYSIDSSIDVPEAQQAYVEVIRYNVGPSRRKDLLRFVPAEQVADPVDFGVGPHVSWRFVMAPIMGMRAGLMHASRKELPEDEARAADCLGEPCLSLVDPSGPAVGWQPTSPPQPDSSTYTATTAEGLTGAARGMQELWESLTADGMDPFRYTPEAPHFVFVISLNVGGQEAALSVLARQSVVMDDSISEIWTHRYEVAGMPAEFSTLAVPRR